MPLAKVVAKDYQKKIIAMKFYILAFLLLFTVLSFSLLPDSHPDPKTEKAGTAKIVLTNKPPASPAVA